MITDQAAAELIRNKAQTGTKAQNSAAIKLAIHDIFIAHGYEETARELVIQFGRNK